MVNKLKELAGGATEGQFAQTVRDSAQQIWLVVSSDRLECSRST